MTEETFKLKEGLYYDISSEFYHNLKGTFSSSQLKDLEDPEYFHKKYILKEIAKVHIAAFDIGTFFHTSLLEPEKLDSECAVYEGIRRGKEWEAFQAANAGKAIITKTEHAVALGLCKAVMDSPVSVARLEKGTAEVSAFLMIRVVGCSVFVPSKGLILGADGWEKYKSVPTKGRDIWLKVRADKLHTSHVLDLKSTTGNAKDSKLIRKKIFELQYDLSAALYLDIFSPLMPTPISEFVWTFASKDFFNCRSYIASQDVIKIGRKKWSKAVVTLAEGMDCDWKFEDFMDFVTPPVWEYEHIKAKAEDSL
jgi:hypothetical protein